MKYLILIFCLVFVSACGEDATIDSGDDSIIYIAAGNSFATADITAPSGANIVILNRDDATHSVTSQSAEDAFDNTGTFDVLVASDGTGILTLPMAASGTVFFFYDRFFLGAMVPSSGTITIE